MTKPDDKPLRNSRDLVRARGIEPDAVAPRGTSAERGRRNTLVPIRTEDS